MKLLLTVLAIVAVLFTFSQSFAADPSTENNWQVYGKTGWFSWVEEIAGSEFIRDDGILYAVGATRTDKVYKALSIRETVEVWGGFPAYDGQDIFSGAPLHYDNSYIGTREEIRTNIQIPITATLTADPFIGVAHKWWYRHAERELWNTMYVPVGMRVAHQFDKSTSAFIEGSFTVPVFTSNHVHIAGYEDVSLRPKARIGRCAEIGVAISSLSIGLSYEVVEFDDSDPIISKSTYGRSSALFFQPYSETSTAWLKIGYNF